jgi:hypothetical protein
MTTTRGPSGAGAAAGPATKRSSATANARRRAGSVAVAVVVVVAALLMLSRCSRSIAGRGSLATIVGDWWVTYGSPAVVTIKRSHAGYVMTAKTPLRVEAKTCDLPSGTVVATFAAHSGASFKGQHGLWNPSNCVFAVNTTVTLTLHRDDRLTELIGPTRERHDLTRV